MCFWGPMLIFSGSMNVSSQFMFHKVDSLLLFLFVVKPTDLLLFISKPDIWWNWLNRFWAASTDFFLLMQSVTSSAYATILGAFLIGFGTGEMLVSNCILKRDPTSPTLFIIALNPLLFSFPPAQTSTYVTASICGWQAGESVAKFFERDVLRKTRTRRLWRTRHPLWRVFGIVCIDQ